MVFKGVSKKFLLTNEQQYNTLGAFWDEMALKYGLENLQGLGYNWQNDTMEYAIGLKNGVIANHNVCIELPNCGWRVVSGKTDDLKNIYDGVYKNGALTYEIEEFFEDGNCFIRYYRTPARTK